jgi:Ca2+-binding RTX toxin-like protein
MMSALVEQMESRWLLSSTLRDGVLTITGTPRADVISTRLAGNAIIVVENTVQSRFPRAGVTLVRIDGGRGDDFIVHGAGAIPARITGAAGQDVLCGGLGHDTILGGAGNDRLHGHAGDDLLDGGLGDDTLHGGPGFDTAQYGPRSTPVRVNLEEGVGGETGEYDILISIESVLGAAGDDTLDGGEGDSGNFEWLS